MFVYVHPATVDRLSSLGIAVIVWGFVWGFVRRFIWGFVRRFIWGFVRSLYMDFLGDLYGDLYGDLIGDLYGDLLICVYVHPTTVDRLSSLGIAVIVWRFVWGFVR